MSRAHPVHLSKIKIGNAGVIAGILFIGIASFGVMYVSTYLLPLSDSTLSYGLIAFALTVIGLLAPYLILKLIFHEAHLRNWHEKELHLKDFPKDKEQLGKEPNEGE